MRHPDATEATWYQSVRDEYDHQTIIATRRYDETASRRWIVTADDDGALIVTEETEETEQ